MPKRKWYDFGGDVSRDLFSKGGSALGALIPVTGASEVGSYLGSLVGTYFHKLTGIGDYKSVGLPPIKRNTLMGIDTGGMVSGAGAYTFSNGDHFVVTKNEYIGDVLGSKDFRNTRYIVQPGNEDSYPWASRLAPNFNEWEPMGEVWYFKPTSGTAVSSSNPAMGTVALTAEYNVSDPPFEDMSDVLNNVWTVNGAPYQQLALPIECDPNERGVKQFFVRTSQTVGADDSTKWYDLANIQVCTKGMQVDDAVVGQLWHAYMFCFKKPQQARTSTFVPSWGYVSKATTQYYLGDIGTTAAGYTAYNNGMHGCTVDFSNTVMKFSPASNGVYLINIVYANGPTAPYPNLGLSASAVIDIYTYQSLEQSFGTTAGVGNSQVYQFYVAVDGSVPILKTLSFPITGGTSGHLNGANIVLTVYQVSAKILVLANAYDP